MTATLEIAGGIGWRQHSVCDRDDAHFDTASDLVEELGISYFDAEARVAEAEAEAKAVCATCPVQKACLDDAVRNEMAYGVWGGKNPAERLQLRPKWLQAKGLEGAATKPIVTDPDVMHDMPAINVKYQQRLARAKTARDHIMTAPEFVLDGGKKYGRYSSDECMQLLEVVIRNPELKGEELAELIGRKRGWFNDLLALILKTLAP